MPVIIVEHDIGKKRCCLLLDVAVTLLEAIHATCGIDKLALTCVEWVRGVRDFYLYYRIGLALEFYCVVSLAC